MRVKIRFQLLNSLTIKQPILCRSSPKLNSSESSDWISMKSVQSNMGRRYANPRVARSADATKKTSHKIGWRLTKWKEWTKAKTCGRRKEIPNSSINGSGMWKIRKMMLDNISMSSRMSNLSLGRTDLMYGGWFMRRTASKVRATWMRCAWKNKCSTK